MAPLDEKSHTIYVEAREVGSQDSLSSPAPAAGENTPAARENKTSPSQAVSLQTSEVQDVLKKAYRKLDVRILVWYAVVDLLMKMGEANITNAAIMNIEQHGNIKQQLGNLSSEQWALVLSMYDYPHLLLEPVAVLLMKRFSPRIWMAGVIASWGIISMCQGAAQNFGGLMALRTLLGLAGAAFTPTQIFHLACWYPADRLPIRVAIIAATSNLAGTFSGILAFAISHLNGRFGLAGWRYLFLLEGAPVVVCGIAVAFLLPNHPTNAKFLTEQEKAAIIDNLTPTQPQSEVSEPIRIQVKELLEHPVTHSFALTKSAWKPLKAFLTEPISYGFLLIWVCYQRPYIGNMEQILMSFQTCHAIGCKGLLTVLPTVVYQLGLSGTTKTQLLTMPPHVIGAASLLCIALLIQKRKLKSWPVALCLEALSCACYIALIFIRNPLGKYIVITVAAILSFALIPILWPERIRTAHGTTNAALAIGVTAASAGLHGIVGPQVYQGSFGPSYKVSFAVTIGLTAVAILSIAMTWAIIRRRHQDDRQQSALNISAMAMEGSKVEIRRLGLQSPCKYLYLYM